MRNKTVEDYQGLYIPLSPQDPAKPDFHYGSGDEFCSRAPSFQAAEASIEFFRIVIAEKTKYGARQRTIEANGYMMKRLESLPR